jgi:hypothetical protein
MTPENGSLHKSVLKAYYLIMLILTSFPFWVNYSRVYQLTEGNDDEQNIRGRLD